MVLRVGPLLPLRGAPCSCWIGLAASACKTVHAPAAAAAAAANSPVACTFAAAPHAAASWPNSRPQAAALLLLLQQSERLPSRGPPCMQGVPGAPRGLGFIDSQATGLSSNCCSLRSSWRSQGGEKRSLWMQRTMTATRRSHQSHTSNFSTSSSSNSNSSDSRINSRINSSISDSSNSSSSNSSNNNSSTNTSSNSSNSSKSSKSSIDESASASLQVREGSVGSSDVSLWQLLFAAVWPTSPGLKARVVAAVVSLMAAKVLTIAAPVALAAVVDHFTQSAAEGAAAAATAAATAATAAEALVTGPAALLHPALPVALVLSYPLARLGASGKRQQSHAAHAATVAAAVASAFTELRTALFARVSQRASRELAAAAFAHMHATAFSSNNKVSALCYDNSLLLLLLSLLMLRLLPPLLQRHLVVIHELGSRNSTAAADATAAAATVAAANAAAAALLLLCLSSRRSISSSSFCCCYRRAEYDSHERYQGHLLAAECPSIPGWLAATATTTAATATAAAQAAAAAATEASLPAATAAAVAAVAVAAVCLLIAGVPHVLGVSLRVGFAVSLTAVITLLFYWMFTAAVTTRRAKLRREMIRVEGQSAAETFADLLNCAGAALLAAVVAAAAVIAAFTATAAAVAAAFIAGAAAAAAAVILLQQLLLLLLLSYCCCCCCCERLEEQMARVNESLAFLNFGQQLIFTSGLAAALLHTASLVAAGTVPVGQLVLVSTLLMQPKSVSAAAVIAAAVAAVVAGAAAVIAAANPHFASNERLSTRKPDVFVLAVPLNFIGTAYREVSLNTIDLEKLLHLLRLQPLVRDPPNPVVFQLRGGGISFKDVSFAYPPSQSLDQLAAAPLQQQKQQQQHQQQQQQQQQRQQQQRQQQQRLVLNGFNLEVPAGRRVALVGESGSGKTTLIRLLYRLIDPSSGCVLIDDQDLKTLSMESFRRHIGVVPQDVALFNESLGFNLRYGSPEATDAQVEEAVRLAELSDLVHALPGGLETPVGDRGVRLSGGEKQRVGIARCLLRNPEIVLFDEATSALDTHTEHKILRALAAVSRGRTTLVIAHRLSTVAGADTIAVLNGGRVAELGTHAQLLQSPNGLYASMWERQREGQGSEPSVRSP
ncbi:hypothetical protein Emed_001568 [Eimeria media]